MQICLPHGNLLLKFVIFSLFARQFNQLCTKYLEVKTYLFKHTIARADDVKAIRVVGFYQFPWPPTLYYFGNRNFQFIRILGYAEEGAANFPLIKPMNVDLYRVNVGQWIKNMLR